MRTDTSTYATNGTSSHNSPERWEHLTILLMEKLRLGEMKCLAQDSTMSQQWEWDLTQVCLTPKPVCTPKVWATLVLTLAR